MPGGQFDSSKTRVAPVCAALRERGGDWVRELLTLATLGTPAAGTLLPADLTFLQGYWGSTERGLQPPVSLLAWLIRNLTPSLSPTTIDKHREGLLAGDPATVALALKLLRSKSDSRGWYIFEGPTYPDAFIETPDALVVVEGKRTEAGPTTSTTWQNGRHQIWRHMDAAWEIRGHRQVLGLFLVEGIAPTPTQVPKVWREASAATLSASVLEASFPHRSATEREGIRRGFVGVATWQQVCERCNLDRRILVDRVDSLGV